MKFYQIDYIYFIFSILCILIFFIKKYEYLLSIYLVIFLGFSKIGADYKGYLIHFNQHRSGVVLNKIHGELFFKLYMKFFSSIGVSYEFFRIFHIVLFISLICYFIYKISETYSLSLLILYSGYLIYLCSAYRQFISMVFVIIGIYFLKKSKINLAILINAFGMGFHISSILPLIFFIFYKFKERIIVNKKIIIILLIASLLLRFIMIYSADYIRIICEIIGREEHFNYYANELKLFPFGLLTRLIPFMFILIFYKNKDDFQNKIFIMYAISMMLYFLFPFELIIGRLTNNGRILECLIFPILIRQYEDKKKIKKIILIFIIIYFMLVLTNQLLRQIGYYPYINILF